MDSFIQVRIEMPEDSIFGRVTEIIGRLEDRQLIESEWGYKESALALPVPVNGPTNQWVIAVLRDIMDRCVAHHLDLMARGEEIVLMTHREH